MELLFGDVKVNILGNVTDNTQKKWNISSVELSNKNPQVFIIRFTLFWQSSMFYGAKGELKSKLKQFCDISNVDNKHFSLNSLKFFTKL